MSSGLEAAGTRPLAAPAPPVEAASLQRWQLVTLGSLGVGYAGYYLCRSNLSLAAPLLLMEFGGQGLNKETLGLITSIGVLCYAVGKVLNGILCDFLGGRKMFLGAMLASAACTVTFGAGAGLSVFLVVWSLNRLVQSVGWGALVKISSRWFSPARYGVVMSVLSLSYLFGDAAARLLLGSLLQAGLGWREMFYAAAAALTLIAVLCRLVLRESPRDIALPEPRSDVDNLFGAMAEGVRPPGLAALLGPFLTSPAFWMAAGMSLGLTLIREAFTFWTPTYLSEAAGLSAGDAGQYSVVFPLLGGVSVLVFGYLADRARRRGAVMFLALAFAAPVLLTMGFLPAMGGSGLGRLALISLAAFLTIGPYSFLGGAIALSLGAKQGSSTAAGLIDGAGYLGSILSGFGIGALAQREGWNAVFIALALVALGTCVTAFFYWRHENRGLAVAT